MLDTEILQENDSRRAETPSNTSAQPIKHNGVEIRPKRLLGAYYTPDGLADTLVSWALAHRTGPVLDPSFGGCAFLNAAVRYLRARNVQCPAKLVYGVDIDASCAEYVLESGLLEPENCVVRDFLGLKPDEIAGAPFEAVVGNPPYVRHHWLKGATRASARALAECSSVEVPATASSWAYFLLHSLDFIRPGGRLALLVPEAILQAEYAKPIRKSLGERFGRVSLVHIRDRLFEGTDEPVVVVAGAEYGSHGNISIESIGSTDELVGALNASTSRTRSSKVTVANGRIASKRVVGLVQAMEASSSTQTLGELATARIGIVTGCNHYFIRSGSELRRLRIPDKARTPLVTRTTWLKGLEFTAQDHQSLVRSDVRSLMVRPELRFEQDEGIKDWIAAGEAEGVHEGYKCSHRSPWFRTPLPETPDAFVSCIRLKPALLVLNRAEYHCTNTLYSIAWKRTDIEPEAVALGFLTSAASVWAELHGRRYGGGVLKLDLGTLVNLPVPTARSEPGIFGEVDRLLRVGQEDDARLLADQVVLLDGLGLEKRELRWLQRAQQELSTQRIPTRGKKPRG